MIATEIANMISAFMRLQRSGLAALPASQSTAIGTIGAIRPHLAGTSRSSTSG